MKQARASKPELPAEFDPDRLQSAVIDFVRFPLIIGVLFVHNYLGYAASLPVSTICGNFFSQTLGSLTIPAFFFISGFLFFLHTDNFDSGAYRKKLQSRAKTLLIPYLFWNILSLTVCSFAHHLPKAVHFFSEPDCNAWTGRYLLQALWALPGDGPSVFNYPYAYQFWFIRDLMVMVVLTPIIYFLVKKCRIRIVALLGILWFSDWWQRYLPWLAGHGLGIEVLFFFTTGAWFAVNRRNFIEDCGKAAKWAFVLYPPVAIADVLTKLPGPGEDPVHLPFLHYSGILLGIVASFALAAHLLKTGKARVNTFLASASFFVFAVHEPLFLTNLRTGIFAVFQPKSDVTLTAVYFLLVMMVAVASLGLYWLLRRYLPRFTRIITGGR